MSNNKSKTTQKTTAKNPQVQVAPKTSADEVFSLASSGLFTQLAVKMRHPNAFTEDELNQLVETLKAFGNLSSVEGYIQFTGTHASAAWPMARPADYRVDKRLAKFAQPIKVVGDTSKLYERKDLRQHPTVNMSKVLNPDEFNVIQTKVLNGIRASVQSTDVTTFLAPKAFVDTLEVVANGFVYNSNFGDTLPVCVPIAAQWFEEGAQAQSLAQACSAFAVTTSDEFSQRGGAPQTSES